MPSLDDLKQLTGQWKGHSSLWFRPDTPATECETTATLGTVAGGQLVTVDYTWSYAGAPHDGHMVVSVDETEGVHMAWCDSFHMSTKLMDLQGAAVRGPVVAAVGTYSLPEGEPWGWRIEIEAQAAGFQLRMFNILPASMGGLEALAVQSDYTRA